MIQINFLKAAANRSSKVNYQSDFELESGSEQSMSSSGGLIKLVPIIGFPALLIAYGMWNVAILRSQEDQVRTHLNLVQQEVKKKSGVKDVMEQLRNEKQTLEGQIKEVRRLNSLRIKYAQALDTLQSIMPDDVWMNKLSMDNLKIQIEGYSDTGNGISNFIKGLEQSVFFNNVLLTSSTDEKLRTGSFKKFEISCELGETH